jgi:hypothetical protein
VDALRTSGCMRTKDVGYYWARLQLYLVVRDRYVFLGKGGRLEWNRVHYYWPIIPAPEDDG